MAFEVRDNSGALFQSTKKSEKGPDYSGECVVNGVAMQIAGWKKTSAKGTVYLSLSFQTKEAKEEPRKAERIEDDIPF